MNNKENELLLHRSKQSIGLNIDNFISTFNYNIIVMREKINMFITYIEFFHKLHKKYLKSLSNKIELMHSEIINDIHFSDNMIEPEAETIELKVELKEETIEPEAETIEPEAETIELKVELKEETIELKEETIEPEVELKVELKEETIEPLAEPIELPPTRKENKKTLFNTMLTLLPHP
jgi:translation elongation factor EF-G